MAKQKSEFVSALGIAFEFIKALAEEVYALNGTDDHIRRALRERQLVRDFAKTLVNGNVTELLVPYDEFRSIRKDHYVYLGDVKTNDVPEVETGVKPVWFRELEFDHDPTDQEVLDKAKAENCRQPSRAEAETYIRRFTPEQLGQNPRVGLIGPGVRRDGRLNRVFVIGDDYGVDLYWYWTEFRWYRNYRFVVVCKPL